MEKNGFTLYELCIVVFVIFATIGNVLCVVRFVTSDFKSPYKREIIYGAGIISGAGSIIGYFNISDGKKEKGWF